MEKFFSWWEYYSYFYAIAHAIINEQFLGKYKSLYKSTKNIFQERDGNCMVL